MTDTIAEIRARHEAVELALQTTGLRSQEAHADRATLLRALDEAQERAERAEGLRKDAYGMSEKLLKHLNLLANSSLGISMYQWNEVSNDITRAAMILARAAQTLKERNDG